MTEPRTPTVAQVSSCALQLTKRQRIGKRYSLGLWLTGAKRREMPLG